MQGRSGNMFFVVLLSFPSEPDSPEFTVGVSKDQAGAAARARQVQLECPEAKVDITMWGWRMPPLVNGKVVPV
jgi:hypothetical protein